MMAVRLGQTPVLDAVVSGLASLETGLSLALPLVFPFLVPYTFFSSFQHLILSQYCPQKFDNISEIIEIVSSMRHYEPDDENSRIDFGQPGLAEFRREIYLHQFRDQIILNLDSQNFDNQNSDK